MPKINLPKINKNSQQSGSGPKRTKSLETAFANPFRLNEDSLGEMSSSLRSTQGFAGRGQTKVVMSRTERLRSLIGDDFMEKDGGGTESIATATPMALSMIPPRRQEKEDMTDFIAKKREVFLVQMSLDTKRDEIRKLEERAQRQEKALLASEEKLKKDADEFEVFLKKNDSSAQEAIRKAEEETARKQKKTQEIKVLTQQIQALTSEMSKQRELLKTCEEYKRFLDELTPTEYKDRWERERRELRERLRRENFAARHKEWEGLRRRLVEQHRREAEARKEAKKDRMRRSATVDEDESSVATEDDQHTLQVPAPPRLDDEPNPVLPDEEPPIYFRDPQQLMDIFSALEEQNLFLIQNSQETELTLEELRHKFMQTTEDMNGRTGQLSQQISELRQQIESEVAFADSLKARRHADAARTAGSGSGGGSGPSGQSAAAVAASEREKEQLLEELKKKVRSVYEMCGFDGSSGPATLFMLSQLEIELESLLTAIEQMPIEYVKNQEKEKEKARREKKRIEQQLLQERQQDERNRRAIERSLQAPKKRTGKPVMFRSRLLRREVNANKEQDHSKDNDDEMKHLT